MQKSFKSGWVFLLLALLFMVIATMVEKPAVYISLGAMWLIIGLGIIAKNKKQQSGGNQGGAA